MVEKHYKYEERGCKKKTNFVRKQDLSWRALLLCFEFIAWSFTSIEDPPPLFGFSLSVGNSKQWEKGKKCLNS